MYSCKGMVTCNINVCGLHARTHTRARAKCLLLLWQNLTKSSNLYCRKAYHIPYYSINISEYHKKKIILKHDIFNKTQIQESFWGCKLSPCDILTKANRFCLGTVGLLCLFPELQTWSSSDLETRAVFQGCDLCSSNLLVKSNNFGFSTTLLVCLASELQVPSSSEMELKIGFLGCGLFL
jgi:hypothetical protein